jgi:hypothetical protein
VKVGRRKVEEKRIGIRRMAAKFCGRLVRTESVVVGAVPYERGNRGIYRREIEVIVDICWSGLAVCEVIDEQTLGCRIDDVVLEDIVCRVILDLEFTSPCVLRVVVEQGVVYDRALVGRTSAKTGLARIWRAACEESCKNLKRIEKI